MIIKELIRHTWSRAVSRRKLCLVSIDQMKQAFDVLREGVPVSVEAKSFVEPGCRWAHSPSPSKAPGISYQGTMNTFVRMLKTPGGL